MTQVTIREVIDKVNDLQIYYSYKGCVSTGLKKLLEWLEANGCDTRTTSRNFRGL